MHSVSRRGALQGLLGGAVALLGGSTMESPPGSGRLPARNLSPLMFHSPQVHPFLDPLPALPRRSGSSLVIDAMVGTHRFHAELGPSPSFGYGGADYLGPIIEAHSGQTTRLTFRNRLARHVLAPDIDTSLEGASDADRTRPRSVLHLHGGVTPPQFDGHAMATILPGHEVTHTYPNRQEASALWYHDHAMGITRLNVYAGLASLYLLRDRWDTGDRANPLGLPAGEFEIPLVLQEKIFTRDGAQSIRSTPIVPRGGWEGGAVGDVGVVNGAAWPHAEVARGLYRFRILNAGSYSVWNLFLATPAGARMRFWVIGTDGGLLDAPVATTSIRLAPAERADVLVDFAALAPGDTVDLRNDEPAPGQAAQLGEVRMPVFCRFRAATGRGFTGTVPLRLRGGAGRPVPLPPLPRPQVTRHLTISQPFELRLPPSVMMLNNLMYGDGQIETPRQGAVEQWDFINVTPDPHPIHVHLVTFRILGRQPFDPKAYRRRYPQPRPGTKWNPPADQFVTGPMQPPAAWERGAKDTVLVDGGTITRIIVRFPTAAELGFDPDAVFPAPTPGMGSLQGYLWHCHVLDHEDHEMMLRYRLLAR